MRSDTKIIKDSKGMTLVELVVTFAVAAIFMATAALLVVPAAKMTMHVKGMNRVHDDAAIIMETIRNELTYADVYVESTDETSVPKIKIKNPFSEGTDFAGYYKNIAYSDKGGNPAEIGVDETNGDSKGRLQIVYAAIEDKQNGETITVRNEIRWQYGKGLYQNNQIKLGFKKKKDGENIITVKLTVTDPASGYSYTEEADIRCINVDKTRIEEE